MVDEGLVCYDYCLLESIHSFENLHIDNSFIVDYVQQVILVDDILWYSCYVELHVLWIWESIFEVKVFNICQDTLCCWSGHYTFEYTLSCRDGCCWCGECSYIIQQRPIAPASQSAETC